MATKFVVYLAIPPSFGTLAFRKGLENDNADSKTLNSNDPVTFCRNLMKFVPVTSEITRVKL